MTGKRFHSDLLEKLSTRITKWAGGSLGFTAACVIVLGWAIAGPIVGFSEQWQLFINSTTTIITFLMVFLIQRSEEKTSQALHLKLNKIMEHLGIDERMMDVEKSSEEKLDWLEDKYQKKAEQARKAS